MALFATSVVAFPALAQQPGEYRFEAQALGGTIVNIETVTETAAAVPGQAEQATEASPEAMRKVVEFVLNTDVKSVEFDPAFGVGATTEPEWMTAFGAEPVDQPWASRVAARINAGIADSGIGLASLEVECRSTACRIQMIHAAELNEQESQEFMRQILAILPKFEEDPNYEIQGVSASMTRGSRGAPSMTRVNLRRVGTDPAFPTSRPSAICLNCD